MDDGWICVDEQLPKVGEGVELLMSPEQGGFTGRWEGYVRITNLPDDPDDWFLTSPKGETMRVRYWRKVQ